MSASKRIRVSERECCVREKKDDKRMYRRGGREEGIQKERMTSLSLGSWTLGTDLVRH